MQIRPERAQDIAAIHALTREAFAHAPHRGGTEQDVVDALRAAGALSVSRVAEGADGLIGHVALSPVTLSDGSEDWYGLGPISVAPAHQGRGVGRALMQAALAALEERGAAGCVLLGDPAYYGRFGFRTDPRLRLAGVPAEYFQARLLVGEWPDAEVRYHGAFGG